ncbi:hypothetical protein BGZ58_011261 [Dissophora ornata]|nr:hypothetical protein BGZ58_011261 [Dissophora ornata]
MMATNSTLPPQSASKDSLTPEVQAYPSPSLSPATTFQASMLLQPPSPGASSRRSSSVKTLLKSFNPPASPLDALVMALEATVEEEEGNPNQDRSFVEEAIVKLKVEDEEEDDPDATIPSSPTMFMKRPSSELSLHHLPTMMLPESAASSAASSAQRILASELTPSSLPDEGSSHWDLGQRKMSISSQDSSSSAGSNGERSKEYACTIGNCEKKFYQVAHLRSHER